MRAYALAAAILLGACAGAPPAPADLATLTARASAQIEARRDALIEARRAIHRYPEVSGDEARTAALVAARLEALSFEVRRNVGGHGVVGVLRGARQGRVIAFRADMDAVYDAAPDPAPFASERPGIRHICGHDVHTAIGLALAEGFAAIRADLAGTVVLYFQPAEESAIGARAMIEAGALDAPAPDAIFAVHTAPLEVGTFTVADSAMMTARDRIRIIVAHPRNADAIARTALQRLNAMNTASPYAPQPADGDFINMDTGAVQPLAGGQVQALAIANLITESARARMRAGAEEVAAALTAAHPDAHITMLYDAGWTPGVRNDPATVQRAIAAIRAELGEAAARTQRTVTPAFSEDFGHMQARAPSAYFFIGVSNAARGWVGMPHTPDYMADEEAIFVGARAMTRVMLEELARV